MFLTIKKTSDEGERERYPYGFFFKMNYFLDVTYSVDKWECAFVGRVKVEVFCRKKKEVVIRNKREKIYQAPNQMIPSPKM